MWNIIVSNTCRHITESEVCLLLLCTSTDREHNPYAYVKALRVYKDSQQLWEYQVLHSHFSTMHILLKALHSCKGMGWSLCLPFDPFDISWWEGGGGLGRGRRLHVKDRGGKKNCRSETAREEWRRQGGWRLGSFLCWWEAKYCLLCCPESEHRASVDNSVHMLACCYFYTVLWRRNNGG